MTYANCLRDSFFGTTPYPDRRGAEADGDQGVELSVILPVYDEADVLQPMYRRLKAAISSMGIRCELLFIDDGSRDHSSSVLADIVRGDPAVTAVILKRHFGKESALSAGLAQSGGRAVVIMDADLQDPPELLPAMLAAWRQGADAVLMRRKPPAGRSMLERARGRCLNHILNAVGDIDMPEDSTDFMLYSRRAVAALDLVTHRKRYMKPMFAWAGLRTAMIEYERQPRAAGASKWSLLEFLAAAPDGSMCCFHALLRACMLLGLAGLLAGLVLLCGTAAVSGIPPKAAVLGTPAAVLSCGGLLYLLGWLGKYIVHLFPPARRPGYAIERLLRSRPAQPGNTCQKK